MGGSVQRERVPEWIPFWWILAGTSFAAVMLWLTIRSATEAPLAPGPSDPLLHRFALGVLLLTSAPHAAYRWVYRPLAARAPGYARAALRPVLMFATGAVFFLLLTPLLGAMGGVGQWPGPQDVPGAVVAGAIVAAVVEVVVALQRGRARLAELTRRQTEADVARRVQRALLPRELPRVTGIDLGARCEPAWDVGGDFFDLVAMGPGRVAVVLADVAGKGAGSALVASQLQAQLRARLATDGDPEAAVAYANRELSASSVGGRFVTLFVGDVDATSGVLRYVNAGHNPALIRVESGEVRELPCGGPPLGVDAEVHHAPGETRLVPGSVLLLYSDGVTEATGAGGEEFGEARLRRLVAGLDGCAAAQAVDRVFEEVGQWRAGAPAGDDTTALVVRVTGDSSARMRE